MYGRSWFRLPLGTLFFFVPHSWQTESFLRLLRTFAGVLRAKNLYLRHFKGKHSKLYIVGKLNKWRFWEKKYELLVSSIPQKKMANNRENDHVSFNWINRVSNPSALPEQLHSVNHKGSVIQSVSAFFDILTGYFLINLSSSSSREYAMRIALKIAIGEILQISKIPDTILFCNI